MIDPKAVELFQTETEVMGKFDHPNLLHLFENIEQDGIYYLVIDFCNNGDLMDYIDKHGALGEDDSIYFLMQIMNAFKELHRANVMHRDFKPDNLFLDNDRVVIGDFGFSKMGVQRTNTVLGTPITMAPEILDSEGDTIYSSKVDLFSIGIVFYWMIYGEPPWDPPSDYALIMACNTKSGKNLKFPSSQRVSPHCKDLLQKLTNPNPDLRLDWPEFFSHPLFEEYQKSMKANSFELRKQPKLETSILMKSQLYVMQDLFNANKDTSLKESTILHRS